MEIDVNNGALQVTMESANFDVNIGESVRMDVGLAIDYIKAGSAEINQAVEEGIAEFDANTVVKTTDFNNNYIAKKAVIDDAIGEAQSYTMAAKQYAIGDPTEPTGNSAKYWAEQASSSLSGLTSRVTTIEGKIPSAASASNQLADKAYVASVLPTVNNATLTIQKNGTDVQTFTANASTNVTANITVPTQPSDIGAQDALVSGTNIKTINNNSILGSGNLDINGLPSQTGQSGKFLTTDGTDASWANVDALPSQTGQSGKYLTTDGSSASWATVSTTPSIDNKSITTNGSSQLQTIGVIDQNNTSTAIKTWTGTKAQYDAIVTKDSNTLYEIEGYGVFLGTTQIAAGSSQLNNPFSLLDYKYSEYELDNASWLLSNGQWNNGAVYTAVYNLLLAIYNGTTSKAGVSVKLSTETYADTDFVLNTSDTTFRLPLKVALASGKAVVGNGMTLGLTNGTQNGGLSYIPSAYMGTFTDTYGTNVQTTTPTTTAVLGRVGVTTDETKSGIETSANGLYLYFYVGETVQDANVIAAGQALTDIANLKNLSNISDNGTSTGASWAMPSDVYDTITIGASGATYTAPADGWFCLFAVSSANYSFCGFENTTSHFNFTQQCYASGAGYSAIIPVKKGDIVTCGYNAINGNHPSFYFRFYYAVGSEWEKA